VHCSANTLTAFILNHLYTNDLPYHKGRENHSILTPPTLPLQEDSKWHFSGEAIGGDRYLIYIYELPPAEGGLSGGKS